MKEKIFKILHVIGYISMALLTLIFVVVGVNSCSNTEQQPKEKQNVNNVIYTENNYLEITSPSLTNGDVFGLKQFLDNYVSVSENVRIIGSNAYLTGRSAPQAQLDYYYCRTYTWNNEQLTFYFDTFDAVLNIDFSNFENSTWSVGVINTALSTYWFEYSLYINVSPNQLEEYPNLLPFYYFKVVNSSKLDFKINKLLNYNAFAQYNGTYDILNRDLEYSAFFPNPTGTNGSFANPYTFVLDIPKYFMSNGGLYNRITATWNQANYSNLYLETSNGTMTSAEIPYSAGLTYFLKDIKYVNTDYEIETIVYSKDRKNGVYEGEPIQYIPFRGVWLNSAYQNLILYGDYNLSFNNLTEYEETKQNQFIINVLNMTNNNSITTGFVPSTDSGLLNVFSLFGNVFGSISNILNIQIFNGITIGFLIFIPLIISIILFVVWLFKR